MSERFSVTVGAKLFSEMVDATISGTARLLFRAHEAGDEEAFVRMQTNPDVRRFVGGAPWSEERARGRFRAEYLGQPVSLDGLWATVLRTDGAYIGYCGICSREHSGEMRLANYIAPAYWNLGYATEASRMFIGIAFERLLMRRLVAVVQVGNQASERVLEKLGFRIAKEEVTNGREYLVYELLR